MDSAAGAITVVAWVSSPRAPLREESRRLPSFSMYLFNVFLQRILTNVGLSPSPAVAALRSLGLLINYPGRPGPKRPTFQSQTTYKTAVQILMDNTV